MDRIRKKAAQLLYTSVDSIDVNRPIISYGIDSMIAAEMRHWVFKCFKQDVSLFYLLNPTTTVEHLVEKVEESALR